MSTTTPIVDVFREYLHLYQIRSHGELAPHLKAEWQKLSFMVDSIFSGLYRVPPGERRLKSSTKNVDLRQELSVDTLRVPVECDCLCETPLSFFAGKLQDISTRGAYVHSPMPFEKDTQVRIIFSTFHDAMPLELYGRVAWNNPGSMRKHKLSAGAGVEFIECDCQTRGRLEDYVYDVLEQTLARANLI